MWEHENIICIYLLYFSCICCCSFGYTKVCVDSVRVTNYKTSFSYTKTLKYTYIQTSKTQIFSHHQSWSAAPCWEDIFQVLDSFKLPSLISCTRIYSSWTKLVFPPIVRSSWKPINSPTRNTEESNWPCSPEEITNLRAVWSQHSSPLCQFETGWELH